METTLNASNFQSEVLDAAGYVLVDFWATWCGPCMALAPTVSEIAEEYSGQVKVCKANVDDAPELASAFGIVSIPTLILFKDGQIVNKSIGLVDKARIVSMWK